MEIKYYKYYNHNHWFNFMKRLYLSSSWTNYKKNDYFTKLYKNDYTLYNFFDNMYRKMDFFEKTILTSYYNKNEKFIKFMDNSRKFNTLRNNFFKNKSIILNSKKEYESLKEILFENGIEVIGDYHNTSRYFFIVNNNILSLKSSRYVIISDYLDDKIKDVSFTYILNNLQKIRNKYEFSLLTFKGKILYFFNNLKNIYI